jgi:hypothetical protein
MKAKFTPKFIRKFALLTYRFLLHWGKYKAANSMRLAYRY